jgi:hypothetical protein
MAKKTKVTMGGQIRTTAEAAEAAALPEAYAVRVNADGQRVSKHDACPKTVAKGPLEQKSPAEWAYERIVLYIKKFEEELDNDHEVGMGFVGSDVGSLRIQGMGYFAPDMVTFYGVSPDGAKMQLVQHVNQLSVLLVSEPKSKEEEEPMRIGFQLAAELEEKDADR